MRWRGAYLLPALLTVAVIPLRFALADFSVGSSCTAGASGPQSANGNNIYCNGSTWQYPAYQFGSGTCASSADAGKIQWSGSTLQMCNGSVWVTLATSGTNYLGASAAAPYLAASASDTQTGLYTAGASLVDIAAAGGRVAEFSGSGLNVFTGGFNSSGTNTFSGQTTIAGSIQGSYALTVNNGSTAGAIYAAQNATGTVYTIDGNAQRANNSGAAGHFLNSGTPNTGYAVYGLNSGTGGNYAGYFEAQSTGGAYGVYAKESGANNSGYAVYGNNSGASSGSNYGGYFTTASTGGATGLYGSETGSNNTGYAVQAVNSSTTGWGVYSSGASPNYFSGSVGIGTASPSSTLSVYGGGLAVGTYAATTTVGIGSAVFSGKVGIGTTLTSGPLYIYGTSSTNPVQITNDTTGVLSAYCTTSSTGCTLSSNNGWLVIKSGVGTHPANLSMTSTGAFLGTTSTQPVSMLDINGGVTIGANYAGVNAAPTSGLIVQGSVGVGTTAPASLLSVYGGGLAVGTYAATTLASTGNIVASGVVGIGTGSPNTTVALDAGSTTGAIILPIGTTNQEPSPSVNGMIRYNTSFPGIEAYIGNAWTTLTTGGSAANIYLGTSATVANPQLSSDATSGFYTPAPSTVAVTAGGKEVEQWNTLTNAVDYLSITPSIAGNPATGPVLGAAGTDTNIGLSLTTRGTGALNLNTAGNGAINLTTGGTGGIVFGTTGGTQMKVSNINSAVNYVQINGSATNSSPTIQSQGGDTVVNLTLNTQNASGNINLQSGGYTQVVVGVGTGVTSTVNYINMGGATTNTAPYISATGTDTNVNLYFGTKGAGYLSFSPGGSTQVIVSGISSAVNYLTLSGAIGGGNPTLSATGADTNVNLTLSTKGSGGINLSPGTGNTSVTAGNLTVNSGNVGIGTTGPQATLDVTGYLRLAKYSGQPAACSSINDGAIALTHVYTLCICNGGSTTWVQSKDGTTACSW